MSNTLLPDEVDKAIASYILSRLRAWIAASPEQLVELLEFSSVS